MKIGVVGYSSTKFDLNLAVKMMQSAVDIFVSKNTESENIEIVSGLTNIGVPRIAYQLADRRNFITVGISAEQAFQVHCGIYPVDKQIIHGMNFGDESEIFIGYIDFLIRIGGGRQSHKEVKMFIDKCAALGWQKSEKLIEHELPMFNA